MEREHKEILLLLPLEGSGSEFSSPQVHKRLVSLGIKVTGRTVLRWLEELEDKGHVSGRLDGSAKYWVLTKGGHALGGGKGTMMSFDEALALQTLKRFSYQQIPTIVAQTMAPMFDTAAKRLNRSVTAHEKGYSSWAGKVAVQCGAFELITPNIDPTLFAIITRALFDEQLLTIVYRPRSGPSITTSKLVQPLGLVEVGQIVYLVGGHPGKPNPTLYRLNRVVSAEMLPESFDYPGGFHLQKYVEEQRHFDFLPDGEKKIALRFYNGAGEHLLETPMSHDQTVTKAIDNLEVQGTVMLTQRLRWWIKGFGANVEVLAPESLRQELVNEVAALVNIYASNDNNAPGVRPGM